MKRSLAWLLGIALLVCPLYSDEVDVQDFSAVDIEENDKRGPFSLSITGDSISKARFKKWYLDDQDVEYRDIEIEGTAIVHYDECLEEGVSISLGYDFTQLVWKENPFFGETRFHNYEATVSFFTKRLDRWFWRAQVGFTLDARHPNISEYATYNGLLWGRYDYSCDIGLHAGFLAQTGMKIDRVYPIVGFDWEISDCWKLNMVYPVNMSLVYTWDKNWSYAIASRTFDHRERVGKEEPLSMGLWAYRSTGLEGAMNYEYNGWLKANLHAGWAFGAKLTISDRHNNHKHHYKLDPSGYFGGEVEMRF